MSHDPNTRVHGCSAPATPATGGSTKLGVVGVRVGLGLLAMGDLARAARTGHDAAAAPQAFRGRGQADRVPGCGGGPSRGASDRVRAVVAGTRGGFVGSFGTFVAAGSTPSRGGLSRSIRANKTPSSSSSSSSGSSKTRDVLCATMTQWTREQQQQQQQTEAAATVTATSARGSTAPVQSRPIPRSPSSTTTPQNGATHASAGARLNTTPTPVRNGVSSREGDDGWSRGRWTRGPGDERSSGRTGLVSRDSRASRVDADGMVATELGRNGERVGGVSSVPSGTSAPSVVGPATITTPIARTDQVDYLLYPTERGAGGLGPDGGQEGGPPEVISRTGGGGVEVASAATTGAARVEGASRAARPGAPATARRTASQNGRVNGSLPSGPWAKGGDLGPEGGRGRERLGVISRNRGANGHTGAASVGEERLGVISRAKGGSVSAGARAGGRRHGPVSRAGKGGTGKSAGGDGGERLGVISRAGDAGARVGSGGSNARTGVMQRVHDESAKKAKVKVRCYFFLPSRLEGPSHGTGGGSGCG